MKVTLISAIVIFAALASGNYIFQYVSDANDYIKATERSYFQAVAIFFSWLLWRD